MKITIEPTSDNQTASEGLVTYVKVTMESLQEDLTADQAVALMAQGLIAYGYCQSSIANTLHPEIAKELFGSTVSNDEV